MRHTMFNGTEFEAFRSDRFCEEFMPRHINYVDRYDNANSCFVKVSHSRFGTMMVMVAYFA